LSIVLFVTYKAGVDFYYTTTVIQMTNLHGGGMFGYWLALFARPFPTRLHPFYLLVGRGGSGLVELKYQPMREERGGAFGGCGLAELKCQPMGEEREGALVGVA
jgi:hypothetical protein